MLRNKGLFQISTLVCLISISICNLFIDLPMYNASTLSRNSSVGIGTGYGLDGLGLIPGRHRDFALLHNVQAGSVSHSASYPIDTTCFFPGSKAPGA
jgi:hypothetical protein